jgi:UDPglucose 6-dehydrogenase
LKVKVKVKVTVVGSGYVGISQAVLLAAFNDVTVLDIDAERIRKINNRQSTVVDKEIEISFAEDALSISGTLDIKVAYSDAEFIIVATPTDYDPITNHFDTSSVDRVIKDAMDYNHKALIVIKSTLPVGHTQTLRDQYKTDRIVFSPEFLREGYALYDNQYPSRIIVGSKCALGRKFGDLLVKASKNNVIEPLFIESAEAEAVKLFANTYLAMRVSFFNEMDSYALFHGLDTKEIINGVCLDDRIRAGYNNPSFGYGGYCLPKDTKQLLANFGQVPQTLIQAIVSSNTTRKDFIAEHILRKNPKTVGFYRLVMKQGSDNFRSSAIQGIIERVKASGVEILIYEPLLEDVFLSGFRVVRDLEEFKAQSDIIVANRNASDLSDCNAKVFTRDVFSSD